MVEETPSPSRVVAQALRRYVGWSAIAGGAVAGVVLVGWAADVPALTSIIPGLPAMKVNTAASLLLGFAALWCRSADAPPPWRRSVGSVLAALVVLIGLVSFVQDATGVDFGIDRLLGGRDVGAPKSAAESMGVNTALCVALSGVGLAMLLGHWRTGRVVAQYLLSLALLIALAAWLGYLYAAAGAVGLWSFTPMALHTASLFVVLTIGALLADTEIGFMARFTSATPAGTFVRAIIPATLVLVPSGGLVRLWVDQAPPYGPELGVALFALINVACLAAVTLAVATKADRQWTMRVLADAKVVEETAERYRYLIETSLQGIVIHRDGKALFANTAALNLLGCKTLAALRDGPPLHAYFAPEEQARIAALLHATVDSKEMSPMHEVLIAARDKKERWVLRSTRRITWQGAPAIQSLMIDVTGRHIAEAQLRQAQKMEAVGQLTAGVAHEFNNLLSVIMGSAEVLSDDMPVGSEGADTLQRIIHAADSGARLTNSLLAFSRKRAMTLTVLDPAVVLDETCRLARASLEGTANLSIKIADGVSSIRSDATLLQSAVLNLIFNARDACAHDCKITIDVRNAHVGKAPVTADGLPIGDYVVTTVHDNGCGMTEETRGRVFEPFFTTKDVGKGTGLGLSMVFGFVQQMGGRIAVESALGKGTTFTIHLPASTRPIADASAQRLEPVGRPGGKSVVMVVDDDPKVLVAIAAMIDKLGHEAVAAGGGAAAIEVFRKTPRIDLLLTDVSLAGGMSGLDLAIALQARQPGLPTLFMSGYEENAVARNGVVEPGITLLSKPFQRHELGAALDAMLAPLPGDSSLRSE